MYKEKKIKALKIVLLVAGPIVSVIVFFVSYYSEIFGNKDKLLSAVPALMLAILAHVITDKITNYLEGEQINDKYEQIQEMLRFRLDVMLLGSQITAMDYIHSNLDKLMEVCNTSISFNSIEDYDARKKLYENSSYNRTYLAAMKLCAEGELIWKDIGGLSSKSRLLEMKKIADSKGNLDNYRCHFLADASAQINFVVLKYKDGKAEVLFNWDHRNKNQEPEVILSRDKRIVQMFLTQHTDLFENAVANSTSNS